MDSRRLWQAVLGELEVSISVASFKTWFQNTAIISTAEGRVIIGVPNPMAKSWLERKFTAAIKESLTRAGLEVKSLEYRIATPGSTNPVVATPHRDPLVTAVAQQRQPNPSQPRHSTAISVATAGASVAAPTQSRLGEAPHPQLNTRYTFDHFVVGSSNEMAYATARAVAKFPGQKYNPLFIYGGVGLGKTHLIQAIGNELARQDSSLRLRYVTSEQLTNEFVTSLQTKRTKRFADLYRNLDILIVDDIQFLGNKEKTQEEFFHTFNALHQAGKQIVLSSDKPPKAIPHLEDRLRSRFEWGMTADIQRPDLETRAAIIRRKAVAAGLDLPLELVEYLARHFQHNIRELEGALTRLIAHCEHHHQEPSVGVVKTLLGTQALAASRRRAITPRAIIEQTAMYFDLQPADITGSKRDKDIVVPRQIAMYLMRKELNLSYPKIASQVGGRDHTTAMHSVTKIEKLLEADDELRAELNQVKERINV